MQNCHFISFDITIRGTQPPYHSTAHFAGSVAEGSFNQAATQPHWQTLQTRLGEMSASPGNALITETGAILFGALMVDDIRQLWARARAGLAEPKVSGLRLRLALHPPEVASLPWECLYDPDRRELFAASGRTPLVRVENQERFLGTPRSLATELPIKILIVVPEDPTGTVPKEESRQLLDLLHTFGPDLVDVEAMDGHLSLVDMRRRLDETEADILHVIAHGEPRGILLWQDAQPTFVPSHVLRVALERTRHVKFAFLSACQSGQSPEGAALDAVGPHLLQAGIPAVVAMQYEISREEAAEFSRFLYEELLTGPCPGAIDAAVGYARSNLYIRHPDRVAFGTPVLWMNAPDGQVFHLSTAARRALSRAEGRSPTAISAPADGTESADAGSIDADDSPSWPVPKSADTQPYEEWLAEKENQISSLRETEEWRLLRFEWQKATETMAEAVRRLERLQPDAPDSVESTQEVRAADLMAQIHFLQGRIEALAEAVGVTSDHDSPTSESGV